MKKLFALLLSLTLILCGCGRAASAPEETQAPRGTPVVYMPEKTAGEEEAAEEQEPVSFEELLEELYMTVGCFCYDEDDYEAFQELKQGEETRFRVAIYDEFVPGEEEQALQSAINEAGQRAHEIYLAVQNGDPPEGNYQVDWSLYPEAEQWAGEEMRDKLPEEWFALQALCHEKYRELSDFRAQKCLDCCLSVAEAFSAQGCEAQVYGLLNQYPYQQSYDYVCFVTMSPEKMWELAEIMEGYYFIEPCYEEVALRFNIPVWPEG